MRNESSGRLLALLLALLAALTCLTGCGAKPAADQDEDTRLVVGFSQLGSESSWRLANTASMLGALSRENGYELLLENAKQKQENQLAAVRNFILQGVDLIVIAPVAETGWESVLQEAKEAGIPVIIMDRAVAVEDESLYLCSVGSDFLSEGRRAVAWLEDELARRGRADDAIRILHLQGTYGATSQLFRTKPLEDAADANDNWTIAAQLPGDYTEAKAYEVVRDYLLSDRGIDVIYSENDNMTFGAMRALEEAGISYGGEDGVILISFDAVRQALQYCMEGRINLCVECNPLHGPRVEELIRQYEAGQEVPKHLFVEELIFTPDSLTQELIDQREY